MIESLIGLTKAIHEGTGDYCSIEINGHIAGGASVRTYIASRGESMVSSNGESIFKEWNTVGEAVAYLKQYLKEYGNA